MFFLRLSIKFVVIVTCYAAIYEIPASGSEVYELPRMETVTQLHAVILDGNNWDIVWKYQTIKQTDAVYLATEMLGAIRSKDSVVLLTNAAKHPTNLLGLSRGYRHKFVALALGRIVCNEEDLHVIIDMVAENRMLETGCLCFVPVMLPYDSSCAIVARYKELPEIKNNKNKTTNLQKFQEYLTLTKDVTIEELPPLSDFVLNHPLYKARQAVIETNIAVFKKQNNPAELDENLLTAVGKLGEVRSIEAVEVLVPYLLLKTKSGLKPLDNKTDKKLLSLQEYPVAVTLAEIGIPSIWGLLNEIAKREKNSDEYRQVAYNVMTSILPQVAIPGFVNATLEKQTDEIAKIRLAKMFPIMGITDSPLLVPYARDWESTDGLFKTNAKFISLDKKEVTLEKPDGKRTTIGISALRKVDQDYVKEQLAPKPEKPKTDSVP